MDCMKKNCYVMLPRLPNTNPIHSLSQKESSFKPSILYGYQGVHAMPRKLEMDYWWDIHLRKKILAQSLNKSRKRQWWKQKGSDR